NANANSILWDGKDGAGQPLPVGTHQADVSVQLQGAEDLISENSLQQMKKTKPQIILGITKGENLKYYLII
ncbi:hypothetical protein, partial [Chryseobacterium sp. 2R14A]|uniref:hypothetical protein n=1 Tax=Chryseobacterium sp. 2R14A TaxID=3380353 RepID=UPI003CF541A4